MDWKDLKLPTNAINKLSHPREKNLLPKKTSNPFAHARQKKTSRSVASSYTWKRGKHQKWKKGGDLAAATIITEASSAGDVCYHRRPKKTTWYSIDSILPVILLRYASPSQTLGCRIVDIHYPHCFNQDVPRLIEELGFIENYLDWR